MLENGGWTPWKAVYTEENVVGPITQAGGIHAGGVIQRVAVAGGGYVKFADGTLINYVRYGATLGLYALGAYLFQSQELTWTYPHAFVSNSIGVSGSVVSSTAGRMWLGGSGGAPAETTAFRFRFVGASMEDSERLHTADILAVGRWY